MNFTLNGSSPDALRSCFSAFKSLLSKQATPQASPSLWDNFNKEETREFLRKLKKISDLESNCGKDLNIFELCSLGHDEVKNCRILAWLLDENAPHGLGHRFLEELLFLRCEPNDSAAFKEALDTAYATRTEICPNSDNTDRVDIVCESIKILVFIEVKINSSEHTSQTDRYHTRLLHNSAGRKTKLIFISVNDAPSNEHAKNIYWKEIGEIANKLSKDMNPSFIQTLLKQYQFFVMNF